MMSAERNTPAERTEYIFAWGNNERRAAMKGRRCIVLYRGRMNSCLIRFVDNGQQEVVSRNALRKPVTQLQPMLPGF